MSGDEGGQNQNMMSAASGVRRWEGMSRLKVRAARVSVCSNAALVLLKLIVGLHIGSVAVVSEAIHSTTDLFAALIAYFAVRVSDQPPDREHPYGHGKLESVSGLAEALLIAAAGIYILIAAAGALTNPGDHPPGWGIAVMALSAVVNTFVTRYLFAVARRTDSIALRADARHLSLDVVTSIGVCLGLGLVAVTGLRWFDPLVAGIVGLFVLKTAVDIAQDAAAPLVDRALPDGEIAIVEGTLRADARILGWHKLRTRQSGSQRHVDVHIQVDDAMSLREAHQVTEELEDRLREALPNAEVIIHTEPFEEEQRHHAEIPH